MRRLAAGEHGALVRSGATRMRLGHGAGEEERAGAVSCFQSMCRDGHGAFGVYCVCICICFFAAVIAVTETPEEDGNNDNSVVKRKWTRRGIAETGNASLVPLNRSTACFFPVYIALNINTKHTFHHDHDYYPWCPYGGVFFGTFFFFFELFGLLFPLSLSFFFGNGGVVGKGLSVSVSQGRNCEFTKTTP